MTARLCAAAAVALALAAGWVAVGAVRDAALRPAAAPAPLLTDDDGGRPMFTVPALAPGQVLVRCIRLRYGGEDAARVALAADVEGALAERVALTVERGSGGRFDRCDGFRGEVVYAGTLAGLRGRADAAPWRARRREEATYRFTVAAPADLPQVHAAAGAEFAWEARPDGGAGPREPAPARRDPRTPAAPAPAPGGGPGTARPAPAAPVAAAPVARPRGGSGRDTARRGAARDRARGHGHGPAGPGDRPAAGRDGTRTGPAGAERKKPSALSRALGAAIRVAGEAAQRAAFPLLLLLLIALFLIAQHRIDRKDPKLALAPVHRELDLAFEPFPPGGDPR